MHSGVRPGSLARKVTAWAMLTGANFKTHHRSRTVISRFVPGVVQVPHNGQPIVLMNDARPPVVTRVLPASLRLICTIFANSARSADSFCPVFTGRGTEARQDQQRYFEQLAWRLHNEIDLNADLGEGCASDAELLTLFPLPILPVDFMQAMRKPCRLRA